MTDWPHQVLVKYSYHHHSQLHRWLRAHVGPGCKLPDRNTPTSNVGPTSEWYYRKMSPGSQASHYSYINMQLTSRYDEIRAYYFRSSTGIVMFNLSWGK